MTKTPTLPYGSNNFQEDFNVSCETMEGLQEYARLLKHWQKTINLIGNNTINDLWWRHFADSAQLLQYIPDLCDHIIDFGSGGGFPAIILAALRPQTPITMYEADRRKAVFLREAIRKIQIKHC